MSVSSNTDELAAGEALVGFVAGTGEHFPAAWVDVVYNVARRSDTWTAHH